MGKRDGFGRPTSPRQSAQQQQEHIIMRNTPVIRLEVQQGASSDPSWKDVQASNGETYSFRYTGGDDNKGNVSAKVGNGVVTFPLRLDADKRYGISGCSFRDDKFDQLSWRGDSEKAGNLIDKNDKVQTAYYTIVVTDKDANCEIPCDPRIVNE